ncbi:hypothetical protein [Pelagibius sp. Alg239-R121]|uniref:hypothetical protein n=1 Tax=Pelagibius sp. Alg239-R121 TaxID=2993448 RepID=UPI0024A70953|nr:hypothetical protein [Pelagibius sp. Alg239-R121]
MVTQDSSTLAPSQSNPDHLPKWVWLWLPLAVAVVLAFIGQVAPDFYSVWFGSEERGVLELSHALIPLAGFFLSLRILFMPQVRSFKWLWLWVVLAALGCLYIGGEEASWGQHYMQWDTPEAWEKINDQEETNLHNTSSWFDQKPRALLEIGVILGGILIPLAALKRPEIRATKFAIILPPLITLPTAVLAEFSKTSERILSAIEFDGLIFSRASEVQETFFFYFILLNLVILKRRLRASKPLAQDSSQEV